MDEGLYTPPPAYIFSEEQPHAPGKWGNSVRLNGLAERRCKRGLLIHDFKERRDYSAN